MRKEEGGPAPSGERGQGPEDYPEWECPGLTCKNPVCSAYMQGCADCGIYPPWEKRNNKARSAPTPKPEGPTAQPSHPLECYEAALRMFAAGSISGQVSDWPQLVPGIRALLAEVDRLRSPLTWSREKPKVPGFYWYRQGLNQRGITEVYPCFGRLLMFEGDGSSIDILDNCQWAGPIPEPTPPEGGSHGLNPTYGTPPMGTI